ncbi:MAG: hypothetical protein V1792_04635 [Pseudomonadota bacterium]
MSDEKVGEVCPGMTEGLSILGALPGKESVMDAPEIASFGEAIMRGRSRSTATETLGTPRTAVIQLRKSVGRGEDVWLEADDAVGAGVDFEGSVLEVNAFLRGYVTGPSRRLSRLEKDPIRRNTVKGD